MLESEAAIQEGGIGLPADLVESGVQHVEVEALGERATVVGRRALGAAGQLVIDGEQCRRSLGIGDDGEQRLVMIRHRVDLPHARLLRIDQALEVVDDEPLDALGLEVADGDDGHQVRSVPVAVEAA